MKVLVIGLAALSTGVSIVGVLLFPPGISRAGNSEKESYRVMLEERIRLQDEAMAALERRLLVNPIPAPTRELAPTDEVSLQALQNALLAMEGEIAALEDEYANWTVTRSEVDNESRQELHNGLTSRLGSEAVLSYQAVVLDTMLDPSVRLDALEFLKMFPPEMRAREPIALQALELLNTLEQERTKERVIDALDGVVEPDYLTGLISLLRTSESEGVREEVIKSLRKAKDVALVWDALVLAAEQDESERVRAAAQKALD